MTPLMVHLAVLVALGLATEDQAHRILRLTGPVPGTFAECLADMRSALAPATDDILPKGIPT